MAKMRFTCEVGAIYRGRIRKEFNKARRDILYESPEAEVIITENKSLLESEFTFTITGAPDYVVEAASRAFTKFFEAMGVTS